MKLLSQQRWRNFSIRTTHVDDIFSKALLPAEDLAEYVRFYVPMCCFGCEFHDKLVISENLDTSNENKSQKWIVAMQMVRTAEELEVSVWNDRNGQKVFCILPLAARKLFSKYTVVLVSP